MIEIINRAMRRTPIISRPLIPLAIIRNHNFNRLHNLLTTPRKHRLLTIIIIRNLLTATPIRIRRVAALAVVEVVLASTIQLERVRSRAPSRAGLRVAFEFARAPVRGP